MLLNCSWNGQPSPAEKARRQSKPATAEVFDGPVAVDHAAREAIVDDAPDDDEMVDVEKASNPIHDAISAHNAHAPTPGRIGRRLAGGPTSPDNAPLDPRSGQLAPGAPQLAADRTASASHPDSSSPPRLADRSGPDRPLTPAPSGLDFTSVASGEAPTRNDDGGFLGVGDVPVARLDLQRQGFHDAARVFTRPNAETLPNRAAAGTRIGQPNRSTDERNGQ